MQIKQEMKKHINSKISSTTGVTSRTGTVFPSEAPEFTPGFSVVRVTRSLVLCVCIVDSCLSLFFFFLT
jgi:hypothetical protein